MAIELVGRGRERDSMLSCLRARKNILLEGPVGVGKTHLALSVIASLGKPCFRVDGDNRFSEQKLAGWFDPPLAMKIGFVEEAFIAGPLVQAMRAGGVLFINELNRFPESVQNVLLPAIDERMVQVPRLGEVKASDGFIVIATQNPKEFVATSHLSEALLDRFELIVLDYQSEDEETAIVERRLNGGATSKRLASVAVRVARGTRDSARVRRGASVRAAISVAELAQTIQADGVSFEKAVLQAAWMALPNRIEIERDAQSKDSAWREIQTLIAGWVEAALLGLSGLDEKKKV